VDLKATIMTALKQLENMEYFKYMDVVRNDTRRTRKIKSRIAMVQAAFNRKKNFLTRNLGLTLRKKLVKCYIWNILLYGAQTYTLRKADQKYLESSETWCWREGCRSVIIKRRKVNWIGYICVETLS
jgi:hypothetical protein